MTSLDIARLEQTLKLHMQKEKVPGLALAILYEGEIIYTKGFGRTSVEDAGVPVSAETLFRIGSTSKPLTGTLIMRLVEAGKLDLDTPVTTYIPWFTLPKAEAAKIVTLRHLLTHQAGLGIDMILHGGREAGALKQYVQESVLKRSLIAPPGKVFSYSDSPMVAACIAEEVTGQPFAKLMKHYVFEPLSMHRTTYDPLVAMTYPLALAHDLNEDGSLRVQHTFTENVAEYPVAFAMSTVLDLANFAKMQMNGDRFNDQPFLQPLSIAQMHTMQTDLFTVSGRGYGLTFFTDTYKGVCRIGHPGNVPTYGCQFELIPESGAAVIMLFNRTGTFWDISANIVNQIFDELLDLPADLPKPVVVVPDVALFPNLVGSYLHPEIGLQTIRHAEGTLMLESHGEITPLDCVRRNLFVKRDTNVSLGFVLEESGSASFMVLNGLACERYEKAPVSLLNPMNWKRYEGTYVDMFSGKATVKVTSVDLTIEAPNYFAEPAQCEPLTDVCFTSKQGLFEFDLSADGQINWLIWQRGLGFKPEFA